MLHYPDQEGGGDSIVFLYLSASTQIFNLINA